MKQKLLSARQLGNVFKNPESVLFFDPIIPALGILIYECKSFGKV